jgi:hypothetical protein
MSSCAAPAEATARLRALRSREAASLTDNWQPFTLRLAVAPAQPARFPSHLAPSLAWAPQVYFSANTTADGLAHSVETFGRVGLSVVPHDGAQLCRPTDVHCTLASPQERSAGNEWAGLQFGLEASTFQIASFLGPSMGDWQLMDEATMKSWLPKLAQRGLSASEVAREEVLWRNAKAYCQATGFKLDPAYDGYFFQQDLNATAAILERAQPNYLFVDSEAFPLWTAVDQPGWLDTVNQSVNAQARRRDGEGDTALATRIVTELLSSFASTVLSSSANTAWGAFAGMDGGNNQGFGSFPWSVLAQAGAVSMPAYYGKHSIANLQAYAAALRAERRALDASCARPGRKLIPWLTVGTWGRTRPVDFFDQLLHTYLNGAVGFALYSWADLDDMEYFLQTRMLMDLLLPVEELVVSGVISPERVAVLTTPLGGGCVTSAITAGKQTLVAVTPMTPGATISLRVEGVAGTGAHTLVDLGTGAVVGRSIDSQVDFKGVVNRSILLKLSPVAHEEEMGLQMSGTDPPTKRLMKMKTDDRGVMTTPSLCGVAAIPANLSYTKATGGTGGVLLRVERDAQVFNISEAIHGSHGLGFALHSGDLQVSVGVNFQNSLVKGWVPTCGVPADKPKFQCMQSRAKRSSDQGRTWQMQPVNETTNRSVTEFSNYAFQEGNGEVIQFTGVQVGMPTRLPAGDNSSDGGAGDNSVIQMEMIRSSDNAKTQTTTTAAISAPSGLLAEGWISTSHSSIVQLGDGTLIANVYAAWKGVDGYNQPAKRSKTRVCVIHSTDRGRNWRYLSTVAWDPLNATVAEDQSSNSVVNGMRSGYDEASLVVVPAAGSGAMARGRWASAERARPWSASSGVVGHSIARSRWMAVRVGAQHR